jgi:hypothetical protein
MNWKGCGRKRSWPNLRYYPGICLEGLTKTTKNLSQHSRSPGRDLNPGPPEYEAGVLTTRTLSLVISLPVTAQCCLKRHILLTKESVRLISEYVSATFVFV